jgi:putative acetyltransferase
MIAPHIRPERTDDAPRVRALLQAAFKGRIEASIVDELRRDGDMVLALTAELDGEAAGYIAFSRLDLDLGGRTVPAIGLAPLGVRPDYQRQGIGSALVRDGLTRMKDRGERLVFVLGDPAYYGRFGFAVIESFVSRYAGPYFQALALAPDAPAAGKVSYPRAFAGF